MSSAVCQSCGQRSQRSDHDRKFKEALEEATSHLDYLLSNLFPNYFKLKEDVERNLQDNFIQNEKYILFNKIAYFSMKSIESRHRNVSVIKSIERKKIKILEKSIQVHEKLSKLKELQSEQKQKEAIFTTQQQTRNCLDTLNQALLYPLLDYSRLRLVLNAFVKFPIECGVSDDATFGHSPTHTSSVEKKSHKTNTNKSYSNEKKSSNIHIHTGVKESVGLSGVSSILGLPLPDGGDYSCLSPLLVASALAHVTHLLAHLARAFNVPLPHPMLPFDTFDFAVIKQFGDLTHHIPLTPAFKPVPGIQDSSVSSSSSSKSNTNTIPTQSNTDRNAKSEICNPLLLPHPLASPRAAQAAAVYRRSLLVPSSVLESQRGSTHSSALLWKHPLPLCDVDQDQVNFYDVNDFDMENIFQTQLQNSGMHWIPNTEFASGLLLLQANVIHLCLTAGLRPEDLWPPQAFLRNLNLLSKFCLNKTRHNDHTHDSHKKAHDQSTAVGEAGMKNKAPLPTTPTHSSKRDSNNFSQLGESLKAYCETIQAGPNKIADTADLSRQLLAASRKHNLNKLETHFYNFDSNKFKREHVHKKGNEDDRSADQLNDAEDNDLVHVSFDYEESDDDDAYLVSGTICTNGSSANDSALTSVYAYEEDSYDGSF